MVKIKDTFRAVPGGWKCVDPDTGATQEGNSYRNLKWTWIDHRRDNNLPVDSVEVWIHEQTCNAHPTYCEDGSVRRKLFARDKTSWGPKLWRELHKAALDGTLTFQWMTVWEESLPSFGCACRSEWRQVKMILPFQPTFSWTVTAHNLVNEKLGKPKVSEEQARVLWSKV